MAFLLIQKIFAFLIIISPFHGLVHLGSVNDCLPQSLCPSAIVRCLLTGWLVWRPECGGDQQPPGPGPPWPLPLYGKHHAGHQHQNSSAPRWQQIWGQRLFFMQNLLLQMENYFSLKKYCICIYFYTIFINNGNHETSNSKKSFEM